MEKPIIEVKDLSKLYRLGVIGATTLQDSVTRTWYRIRGKEEQLQKVGTKHLMIEPDDPIAVNLNTVSLILYLSCVID